MSIAVISLGGKQFTVSLGKIIDVPHLKDESKKTLELTDLLSGKKVVVEVVGEQKDKKIRVIKFKNKTRYTRTKGHRQALTRVKINQIGEEK